MVEGPLEPVRSDWRMAYSMALSANMNRTEEQAKKKTFKISDFMPNWDEEEAPEDRQLSLVKKLHGAFQAARRVGR